MKKILYLFIALGVVLIGCDPLDETYEELDQMGSEPSAQQEVSVTLSDDDYDFLDEEFGVAGFGNFDNEDQAKEFIPEVLNNLFSHLGNGSSITVTYDLYTPIRINDEVEFTLTDQDYDDLGESFPNLNSEGDVYDAVELKYPSPSEEDVVTLNYDYFTGSGVEARTSKVVFYESRWQISYVPTAEDYAFMGQSFPNFDSRTTARERIAVLFNGMFKFDSEGNTRTSVFTYTFVDDNDDRQFVDFLAVFEFDGNEWIPFQDVQQRTLQFGKEDGLWVPDNTIRYTLQSGDYSDIAANENLGNAGARGNLASFGNFNVLAGNWTTDDIIEAINFILKDRFPNSEEGQKYLVSYDTFPTGGQEVHLILNAEGNYEKVE